MEKSDNSHQQPVEELSLWQINQIHVSENYTTNVTDDGDIFYSRFTGRQDLPESFWENDWYDQVEARKAAERQALSSGTSAREIRGKNDGRLLSQLIANHPNIDAITSSARVAQARRNAGKSQDKDKGKGQENHTAAR